MPGMFPRVSGRAQRSRRGPAIGRAAGIASVDAAGRAQNDNNKINAVSSH